MPLQQLPGQAARSLRGKMLQVASSATAHRASQPTAVCASYSSARDIPTTDHLLGVKSISCYVKGFKSDAACSLPMEWTYKLVAGNLRNMLQIFRYEITHVYRTRGAKQTSNGSDAVFGTGWEWKHSWSCNWCAWVGSSADNIISGGSK